MHALSLNILLIIFLVKGFSPPALHDFWVKFPALIQHFQEHKIEYHELDFLTFLDMHYGSTAENHQQKHDHSDLPFKSDRHPNNHCHCVVAALEPRWPEMAVELPVFAVFIHKTSFSDEDFLPALHSDAIFQPPRQG